jgi:hypothetical protein
VLFDVARLCRCIGDVNYGFGRNHATEGSFRMGTVIRQTAARFGEGRRCFMRGNHAHDLAVPAVDISKCGVADANSLPQHDCKHWLEIARRTADNLKYVRRCRLLLQRIV